MTEKLATSKNKVQYKLVLTYIDVKLFPLESFFCLEYSFPDMKYSRSRRTSTKEIKYHFFWTD